jgi:hypothetical protein
MSNNAWHTICRSRLEIPAHVVYRALAHQTVLLNIETSTYHAVDTVGSRFLDVLVASESLDAAADRLAAEYGQPKERVAADVQAFCDDLVERELIVLRSPPA